MIRPLSETPAADGDDGPFALGWRDVATEHPDGSHTFEQAPLTREDLLQSQEPTA